MNGKTRTSDFEPLKVGELARRTGLTVRTLHHYEAIGLLKPSERTEAGHRLYGADDIARLQQALSLRQLGFSLEEVRNCLDGRGAPPLEVIRLLVGRLRKQIRMQQGLVEHLEALAGQLQASEELSTDRLLKTIEVMKMVENYYTPEQLETLKARAEEVGEERMHQAPNDWNTLYADFRTAMEAGKDPKSDQVQALVARRQALIDEFTGGDAGIEASLTRLWQEKGPELAQQHNMDADPALMDYMNRATQ